MCVTESEERICLWEEDGVVHYDCPDEDEELDCRTVRSGQKRRRSGATLVWNTGTGMTGTTIER